MLFKFVFLILIYLLCVNWDLKKVKKYWMFIIVIPVILFLITKKDNIEGMGDYKFNKTRKVERLYLDMINKYEDKKGTVDTKQMIEGNEQIVEDMRQWVINHNYNVTEKNSIFILNRYLDTLHPQDHVRHTLTEDEKNALYLNIFETVTNNYENNEKIEGFSLTGALVGAVAAGAAIGALCMLTAGVGCVVAAGITAGYTGAIEVAGIIALDGVPSCEDLCSEDRAGDGECHHVIPHCSC
jgi:hypothetical protein